MERIVQSGRDTPQGILFTQNSQKETNTKNIEYQTPKEVPLMRTPQGTTEQTPMQKGQYASHCNSWLD